MTKVPLGVIAGAGDLPIEFCHAAARSGYAVHVVGLVGSAAPDIEGFPHIWVKLGEIGKLLRQLNQWQCRDIVIIGAVKRPHPSEVKFDLGTITSLPDIARLLKGGDDSVLRGVVSFFEGRGYKVHGALSVAPELSIPVGDMTATQAGPSHQEDIEYGVKLLRTLSPFDVGQGVVVVDGRAIAVEGLEGTDAMLERIVALRENGRLKSKLRSGVLVKAPKAGQSMLLDIPTIGPKTVENTIKAGLAGIALAGNQVIMASKEQLILSANRAGIFIKGMDWRSDPKGIDDAKA